MKRLLRLLLLVVLVVGLPADLAFSEAQKPIYDPDNPCVQCTRNSETGEGECGDAAEWGEPSNWICTGGRYCWNTADGGRECQPYCGTRCYSI
jgi:hypothetical protein